TIQEKYQLLIIALTIPQDDLFGTHGIYNQYHQRGIAWERKANMHYFEADGELAFQTDVGLRIHGGNSRRFALKSFRLYFRNAYGLNTLNYPLFKDKDVYSHERLILR
ncbi:hypothetical protein RZS08_01790, partial [Arthrospira platensis SPKY1]|nr:hypothetical protein [Arthrospira platensis SPKY1]